MNQVFLENDITEADIGINDATRTTTVIYPRMVVLIETQVSSPRQGVQLLRAAADRRKGLRTPYISMEEERRAGRTRSKGLLPMVEEGPSREEGREGGSLRGAIHDLPSTPHEKGLLVYLALS